MLPQEFNRKKVYEAVGKRRLFARAFAPPNVIIQWAKRSAQGSVRFPRLTGFMRDFYTPPTLQRITLSKKEDNQETFEKPVCEPGRRLLALDLGRKRVGVAVSDEQWLAVRPLKALPRTSWKKLLRQVYEIVTSFDAQALVLGLPLHLDGKEGEEAQEALRLARNFQLSLKIPVFMQDERLTSHEAENNLRSEGHSQESLREEVDSRAAAIILEDFISNRKA
ncbi:MAG TPA: Holliday junction resolvase RuvX [Pyrinomonadaceae bacterium]